MQGATETCTECGFEPNAVGKDQLGPELTRLASGYESAIAEASTSNCSALSARPSLELWSILGYVGHDPDEYAVGARFNDVAATEMSERIRAAAERAQEALVVGL